MEFVANAICTVIQAMHVSCPNQINLSEFLLKFWFFGHSLGGHIMGRVGYIFKNVHKSGQIPLIVGIDPAGPMFKPYDTERHCLTFKDGEKVLIVHATTFFGTNFLLGHLDFFVNGGVGVPDSQELRHKRALNFILELVKSESDNHIGIGYVCPNPKQHISTLTKVKFSIKANPFPTRSHPSCNPVYIHAESKSPFFGKSPKEIRSYKRDIYKDKMNQEWIKIKFY